MLDTRHPGCKTLTVSSKTGHGEASYLTGEVCAALQAASPSYDGLRVLDVEVRGTQPCLEATRVAVQVSSHCDLRILVHY
jgi:hypothetical protein